MMRTSGDCPEKAELDIGSRARRLAARLRRRVSRARRDERGLTTLEWLLIVAAVAGLAALAVVLVTNVVDDTSEQISGSSARVTAARVAAQEIVDDAARASADQPNAAKTWGDWEVHYRQKCDRLEITYGDAGIVTTPRINRYTGSAAGNDAVLAITTNTQKSIVVDNDSATSGNQPAATSTEPAAVCAVTTGS